VQAIKKLAGQTAIYGLSSMLGRFINFLLVIPHTQKLNSIGDYGNLTALFAIIAFLNIVLTYGMETSYFNFIRNGVDAEKVFKTSQTSVWITTLFFAIVVLLFSHSSASILGFPGRLDYLFPCLMFLVFDTLSALPFAKLRQQERPLKFALIKLSNIFVNVGLNLWFLFYTPSVLADFSQVTLVLFANAIASVVAFLLLMPSVFNISLKTDFILLKRILNYAWPLIFIGLAGIVNETLDRVLLIRILPIGEGSYQNGIYGAFYKLTMVMTMFVQAYKFAAEPFFFKQKESQGNRVIYAVTMYWFVAVCSFIFLLCMIFIEDLAHLFIKNKAYFDDKNGLFIVPILLMANLFLGIYYNLSIWYKLTNNTKIGALVSIIAALLTIGLNIFLIPIYGFVACAFITLLVYVIMCVASYVIGNKYFKVPYFIYKYLIIIASSIVLWLLNSYIESHYYVKFIGFINKFSVLAFMVLIIWLLKPQEKNNKFVS